MLNIKKTTPVSETLNNQQKWLMLALVLFLIVPIPVTFFPQHGRIFLTLIYTTLVIAGVLAVSDSKRQHIIGLLLGSVSVLFVWGNFFNDHAGEFKWGSILSLLAFFIYLSSSLFWKLAFLKQINLNVIFASISGYLIIGTIGGLIFQIFELSIPGSFIGINQENGLFDLHYFSFVTLTTLGFGDISPNTEAAKSITILFSIAGQLYLTILIAILVGKYLSKPKA